MALRKGIFANKSERTSLRDNKSASGKPNHQDATITAESLVNQLINCNDAIEREYILQQAIKGNRGATVVEKAKGILQDKIDAEKHEAYNQTLRMDDGPCIKLSSMFKSQFSGYHQKLLKITKEYEQIISEIDSALNQPQNNARNSK